jgi:hypothetical protein
MPVLLYGHIRGHIEDKQSLTTINSSLCLLGLRLRESGFACSSSFPLLLRDSLRFVPLSAMIQLFSTRL